MEGSATSTARPESPRSRAVFLLLTLVTGALNAISFLALGGVFVSVMTANLALVGIAVGGSDVELAGNSAVALAGYIAGVLLGARYCERCARGNRSGVRALLFGELLLLCGVLAGWLPVDGSPAAPLRTVLLGAAALAMGCQSATIRATAPGVSTTYMTGLLTTLLTDVLARRRPDWSRAALVAAIPVGAALGALVVVTARAAAPLLPVVLLTAVLLLSAGAPGRPDR